MALDITSQQAAWHPLLTIEPTPPSGYTGHWSLALADMEDVDTFTDLSGNDHNGDSAVNPPVSTTDHKSAASNAMVFDNANDYVTVPGAAASFASDTAGVLAAWVKPDDGVTAAFEVIVSVTSLATKASIYLTQTSDGKLAAFCSTDSATQWYLVSDVAVWPNGACEWTHVAVVQNGTAPVLYVNGALVAATFPTGTQLTSWCSQVVGLDTCTIGALNFDAVGPRYNFGGDISDVYIYSKALTAAQMAVLGIAYDPIRWSDADLAMSDGTLYEGRIRGMGPIRKDLGRMLETQFVYPELIVEAYNGDDAVRVILDANSNLAGQTAVLQAGQGTTITDYETKFTGEVRQPDGIQWDDDAVSLTFSDAAERVDVVLPANKIWPATYANAESKSKYLPIPEVLGDFRTTAGGGETVPGFCVDTTVGTGGQFTFGQHLESMEDVYLNGVSTSYTVNQLTGPSLVTLNVAYATLTDSVTANVNGRKTTNSTTYPAAENAPPAWAYDLLMASWGMNLGLSHVDKAAFIASYTAIYYGAGDKCRRWIGTDVQAVTLLSEIASDGFFELFENKTGKWTMAFRLAGAPASTTVVREADIMPVAGGRQFAVQADPERTYANQIVYDFRLKPPQWVGTAITADGGYGASGLVENTTEQDTVGGITRRRLNLRWLHETTGAADRGNRDLYVFSGRLEMVEVDLGPIGVALDKADTFQLIYSKYALSVTAGTPFMVRASDPDYTKMTAHIIAWNMDKLSPRRYQADSSAAWAAATTYNKLVMGYYGAFSGDDDQIYL